jgi:hypothetical protein
MEYPGELISLWPFARAAAKPKAAHGALREYDAFK